MDTLSDFHPGIQYAIRRLINPDLTFENLGIEYGISKQAVQQQFTQALDYLTEYKSQKSLPHPELAPCAECERRDNLIAALRQQLVLIICIHGLAWQTVPLRLLCLERLTHLVCGRTLIVQLPLGRLLRVLQTASLALKRVKFQMRFSNALRTLEILQNIRLLENDL